MDLKLPLIVIVVVMKSEILSLHKQLTPMQIKRITAENLKNKSQRFTDFKTKTNFQNIPIAIGNKNLNNGKRIIQEG